MSGLVAGETLGAPTSRSIGAVSPASAVDISPLLSRRTSAEKESSKAARNPSRKRVSLPVAAGAALSQSIGQASAFQPHFQAPVVRKPPLYLAKTSDVRHSGPADPSPTPLRIDDPASPRCVSEISVTPTKTLGFLASIAASRQQHHVAAAVTPPSQPPADPQESAQQCANATFERNEALAGHHQEQVAPSPIQAPYATAPSPSEVVWRKEPNPKIRGQSTGHPTKGVFVPPAPKARGQPVPRPLAARRSSAQSASTNVAGPSGGEVITLPRSAGLLHPDVSHFLLPPTEGNESDETSFEKLR